MGLDGTKLGCDEMTDVSFSLLSFRVRFSLTLCQRLLSLSLLHLLLSFSLDVPSSSPTPSEISEWIDCIERGQNWCFSPKEYGRCVGKNPLSSPSSPLSPMHVCLNQSHMGRVVDNLCIEPKGNGTEWATDRYLVYDVGSYGMPR